MEKYLVFLIAWFGNKFIEHIKIPQGLRDCTVSKQSHLPWPYSCRIRKDCLLFSPRNTILGIYVAPEILIALEPRTENPRSLNSREFRHLYHPLCNAPFLVCLKREHALWGSCLPGTEIVTKSPAGYCGTQARRTKTSLVHVGCNEWLWFWSYSKNC